MLQNGFVSLQRSQSFAAKNKKHLANTYMMTTTPNSDIRALNERISRQSAFVTLLTDGMSRTIVGQHHLNEALLIGLLTCFHILLE